MSEISVRNRIRTRLGREKRGDRGWSITTRVHIETYWIQGIAEYIFQKYGLTAFALDADDYAAMARLVGIQRGDIAIHLRRQHLLALYRPLGIIARVNPDSWGKIHLTEVGAAVAQSRFFAKDLETALKEIVFAKPPTLSAKRAKAYPNFNVRVFSATRSVMRACDGFIDKEEFNFFVSRIRTKDEVPWAVEGIQDYRQTMAPLNESEKKKFLNSLNALLMRGLTEKTYDNWQDIAGHTFALFSIGTSMVQDGKRLWLAPEYARQSQADEHQEPVEKTRKKTVGEKKARSQVKRVLKLPVPPKDGELLKPPVEPKPNGGAEAENLIAKILLTQGWQIAFYSAKRGFGFDIWARKGDRAMVVEVKSSINDMDAIVLTDMEYKAAQHHGPNYFIAVVESVHTAKPKIWFVANPANSMKLQSIKTKTHSITQEQWRKAAVSALG